MPSLYCLPQILEQDGYTNIWLSTSSAGFAFMDKFFTSHGFEAKHIYDMKYFEKKYGMSSKIRKHMWGFDDSLMFPELRKIINEYSQAEKPLFLVVNTINTHMGIMLPEYCQKNFDDFRDNIYCSAMQMADFLKWFEEQEAAQNSVLVIVGDHLAMDAAAQRFMKNNEHMREVFNLMLVRKNIFLNKKRYFSGLDIMPTLLEALGVQWNDGRLGLGVSLMRDDEQNLMEKLGPEHLDIELRKYSKIYETFLTNGESEQ